MKYKYCTTLQTVPSTNQYLPKHNIWSTVAIEPTTLMVATLFTSFYLYGIYVGNEEMHSENMCLLFVIEKKTNQLIFPHLFFLSHLYSLYDTFLNYFLDLKKKSYHLVPRSYHPIGTRHLYGSMYLSRLYFHTTIFV